MDSPDIELILCTAPAEEAKRIAQTIIEERLAACVNITPVQSVFSWDGEVVVEEEHLMLCKTTAGRRTDLIRRIEELHSYDVPEVLAFSVVDGNASYLAWVRAEVIG